MPLIESRPAFGESIEGPPEQPIGRDHKYRHDGDTERNPGIVACLCHLRDVRAQARGVQSLRSPTHGLRNDARVPSAARGGDCPSDVIGEDSRKNDPVPPAPRTNPEACSHFSEIARKCACSGNDDEVNVPLCSKAHQRTKPDFRSKIEPYDQKDRDWKQQVGRKGGKKLGDGLDPLRQFRAQPDRDADRNPDGRCKSNQNS